MIPIIAGWGKDAKVIAYVGLIKCEHCRNYAHWYLYEIGKKVTLYFVPVAKWDKKWYIVCGVCEASAELNKAEKDEILQESAELPSAEDVMVIWDALTSALDRAVENGGDVAEAFDKALGRLENQHSESSIGYVYGVYMESLQDEDPPE